MLNIIVFTRVLIINVQGCLLFYKSDIEITSAIYSFNIMVELKKTNHKRKTNHEQINI